MMLSGKSILIISPEPWTHLFVSKHHYAIYLASRDNNVFFLNPPSRDEGVTVAKNENISLINYRGFPKGLRFYPRFLQKYLITKKYDILQNQCNVTFDVVWSFDNSVFFDFSALPERVIKICHIVDFNQDFEFGKAASTADYCFCVSEPLRRKLSLYNQAVYKINHGYAIPQRAFHSDATLPGHNRIKAMYAGNLDLAYIDWHLVDVLVSQNPNVDFCFAGSTNGHAPLTYTQRYANFHLLGNLTSTALYAYLRLADIHLIVYRADDFRDQLANPHKFLEYLGTGKVIVSTYTAEWVSLKGTGLVQMSETNEQLPLMFSTVVQYLDSWNSPEKISARKNIASQNTYDKQLDRIEKILGYDGK